MIDPRRESMASLPTTKGRWVGGEGPAFGQRSRSIFSSFGHPDVHGASVASLVKRFFRLPPSESLFCSHRKVTKRCGPMACRPHGEAMRVRKHWPGSAEGTSCAAAEATRPSRGPQAAFPSSTCRQERADESKETASAEKRRTTQCIAPRAVDLPPVSGRRGGGEKARRVARRDSRQFAVSTGTCCQQTPEPTRAVVRLLRTTDPSGCHFSWLLLFGQAKRSDSRAGRREKRLTSLATAKQSGDEIFEKVGSDIKLGPSSSAWRHLLPAGEGSTNRMNRR